MCLSKINRIAIDPIFQPPPDLQFPKRCPFIENFTEIKFELIFDEKIDGNQIYQLIEKNPLLTYEANRLDEFQEYNVGVYSDEEN